MANGSNDTDLTIKKSDRYFEFTDAEFESAKVKILSAIDNFHCTLPQIKRKGGFNPWEDISQFIEALESEGTIKRIYNGVFTAFFRADKVPTKFWIAGDERVGVDYTKPEKEVGQPKVNVDEIRHDTFALKQTKRFSNSDLTSEDFKKMAEWGLSKQETAVKAGIALSNLIQNLKNERFKTAWDEGRQNLALKRTEPENNEKEILPDAPPIPKGILDAELPESLPEREKERTSCFEAKIEKTAQFSKNQQEVADKLGITVRAMNKWHITKPNLQAAYNRGRQKRKEFFETKEKEITMVEPIKKIGREFIEVKAEDVKLQASLTKSEKITEAMQAVAKALNIGYSTLQKKFIQFPELRRAFDAGRAMRQNPSNFLTPSDLLVNEPVKSSAEQVQTQIVETQTVEAHLVGSNRHTEVLEKIKPEKSLTTGFSLIPEPISPIDLYDLKELSTQPPTRPPQPPSDPSDYILNFDGGKIGIFADINLFKMDKRSRDFVNDLIDTIQDFEAGK